MNAIFLPENKVVQITGVSIGCVSLDELVKESLAAVNRERGPVIFACANPHSLVTAETDPSFRRALNQSTLVVADGVGVTLAARAMGIPALPRITGHDYFRAVMATLESRGGGRVFFFGSTPKVLSLIVAKVEKEYPNITICGAFSPPFGEWPEEDDNKFVSMINTAKPDVLWMGMTAPKQEKWVDSNRFRLHAPVIGSIGAVFDFYAGTHPRAPQWMCRMGIEWVYRLCREPRRMWRRNFVSSPRFIGLVLRHRFAKIS